LLGELGSKSAFAYTDSYTIEAVKDGVERIFIASIKGGIDDDDTGAIDLVAEQKTDKPNGVSIKIPFLKNDFYNLENKLVEFIRWRPLEDRPTIHGITYGIKEIEFTNKGDDWAIQTDTHQNDCKALMGGVPYEFRVSELSKKDGKGEPYLKSSITTAFKKCAVALYFEIGDINFSSSREKISYDDKTCRALSDKINKIYEYCVKQAEKVKEDIDKATTLIKALEVRSKGVKELKAFLGYRGVLVNHPISKEINVWKGIDLNRCSITIPIDCRGIYADRTRSKKNEKYIGFFRCRDGTKMQKIKTHEIGINPISQPVLVFDDCKPHRKNQRIRKAMDGHNNPLYLIQTEDRTLLDKLLENTGIGVKNLSEFTPLIPEGAKISYKRVLKLSKHGKHYFDSNWKELEGDLDTSEVFYYVNLYRSDIYEENENEKTSTNVLREVVALSKSGYLTDLPAGSLDDVYGIRRAASKKVKESKNGVNLITLAKETIWKDIKAQGDLQQLIDATCGYDFSNWNDSWINRSWVDSLAIKITDKNSTFLKSLRKYKDGAAVVRTATYSKKTAELWRVYKNLNWEVAEKKTPKQQNSPDSVVKAIYQKYPMVEILESKSSMGKYSEIISNYINLIDKNS